MRAVSGTSGAAPVWRDVMLALHRDRPGLTPSAPNGIEARTISFANGIEPTRREYFLAGTAQTQFAATPQEAQRPRITAPAAGAVYALDPDIPLDRQRIRIMTAGAVSGHRLVLDRKALGPADAPGFVLPGPGAHQLALVDADGRTVDRLRFSVR